MELGYQNAGFSPSLIIQRVVRVRQYRPAHWESRVQLIWKVSEINLPRPTPPTSRPISLIPVKIAKESHPSVQRKKWREERLSKNNGKEEEILTLFWLLGPRLNRPATPLHSIPSFPSSPHSLPYHLLSLNKLTLIQQFILLARLMTFENVVSRNLSTFFRETSPTILHGLIGSLHSQFKGLRVRMRKEVAGEGGGREPPTLKRKILRGNKRKIRIPHSKEDGWNPNYSSQQQREGESSHFCCDDWD